MKALLVFFIGFATFGLASGQTNTAVKAFADLYFGDTQADVDWRLRGNISRGTTLADYNFRIMPCYKNINNTNRLCEIRLIQEPMVGVSRENLRFCIAKLRGIFSSKFGAPSGYGEVFGRGGSAAMIPLIGYEKIEAPPETPNDGIMPLVMNWTIKMEKDIGIYYSVDTEQKVADQGFFRRQSASTTTNHSFTIIIKSLDKSFTSSSDGDKF